MTTVTQATCPDCGQRLMPCAQPPVGHACNGTVHALTGLHKCLPPFTGKECP